MQYLVQIHLPPQPDKHYPEIKYKMCHSLDSAIDVADELMQSGERFTLYKVVATLLERG